MVGDLLVDSFQFCPSTVVQRARNLSLWETHRFHLPAFLTAHCLLCEKALLFMKYCHKLKEWEVVDNLATSHLPPCRIWSVSNLRFATHVPPRCCCLAPFAFTALSSLSASSSSSSPLSSLPSVALRPFWFHNLLSVCTSKYKSKHLKDSLFQCLFVPYMYSGPTCTWVKWPKENNRKFSAGLSVRKDWQKI